MILEKIKADWLAARKARDTVTATVLGTLVGAINTAEKKFNPTREVTEAEVLAEVKKMLDGVIETGQMIANAPERQSMRDQNAIERAVLESYMPQQMNEAEIMAFATEKKAAGLNMGGIMAALKANHPGRYDGKLASTVVKQVLAT